MRATFLVVMLSALWGCSSTSTPAPVYDRSPGGGTPAAPAPSAAGPAAPVAPVAVQTIPTARSAPISETKPAPVAAAAELPPARLEAPPVIKPYREGDWRPEHHVVRKGDTLYSIALDYGEDYRDLAAWNRLEDPAKIRIDQKIRLFPPESSAETTVPQPVPLPADPVPVPVTLKTGPKAQKLPYSEQALAQLSGTAQTPAPDANVAPVPAAVPAPAAAKPAVAPPAAAVAGTSAARVPGSHGTLVWEWPTQGPLAYAFGKGANQKGVGIEGKPGQPVLAGAPGKVVYSGSGLRGYGKLIIIKHDATYLSVYAHNSQLLVKEGQTVAKGQKIAEMGSTDSDRVSLHFEIRRLGKPIDPLPHLPPRAS